MADTPQPSTKALEFTEQEFCTDMGGHGQCGTTINDKQVLKRWLSTKSTIPTKDIKDATQKDGSLAGSQTTWRSIGRGMMGEVFDMSQTGFVIKREYNKAHSRQGTGLYNDYSHHCHVYKCLTWAKDNEGPLQDGTLEVYVPRVEGLISQTDETWWRDHGMSWPRQSLMERTDLLKMERIIPIPRHVRESLIRRFCPPQLQPVALSEPDNVDCLIRVYLGVRRTNRIPDCTSFTLRNFEADLQICDDLELEKTQHAQVMGTTLAMLHWEAKIDANDVEFVLGSAPKEITPTQSELRANSDAHSLHEYLESRRQPVHLWLLDFNNCSSITMDLSGVADACRAYWLNDPYYPRPHSAGHPDEDLWITFMAAYIRRAQRYGDPEATKHNLCGEFIGQVIQEAQRRASNSQGPPKGTPKAPYCPTRGLPSSSLSSHHSGKKPHSHRTS